MSAPEGYERKFADFIRLCEESRRNGVKTVIIADPHALGDNYEEIIESLTRLQRADLSLGLADPPGRN